MVPTMEAVTYLIAQWKARRAHKRPGEEVEKARRYWQACDGERDRLTAELDRLDALERAGLDVDDEQRSLIGQAIDQADAEAASAEIALYRSLGDDDQADRLELARLEREQAVSLELDRGK